MRPDAPATPSRPGVGVWLEAARPKTLPAGLVPVLAGTAASRAAAAGDLAWGRAGLALVVAVALQVAVNFFNDYADGVRGVDTDDRVGPRRVVAAGLVSPPAMRAATALALAVAGAAGIALAWLVGWELVAVGLAAVAATLGYSGGPRPYASAGLGEVSVFVFFGLVATVGSAYVQDGAVTVLPALVSVPVGLLAVALLVVNNLRDIPTDRVAGKATLAVRLGARRTRALFTAIVTAALVAAPGLAVLTGLPWLLLPLLAAVPLWPALRRVRTAEPGPELIAALEATGRGQLVYGILLAAALYVTEAGAVL